MGKSYKKTDICGNGGNSEKYDKRLANRRFRRIINTKLLINPEIEVLPVMREVSDVWGFNKDGKHWFGNMKNGNKSRYPHTPYSEDDYYKAYYKKLKRK
jgi:hypothetical protein